MNDGAGTLVVWIVVPLFVAVGIYLFWYSLRRKRMLEDFAGTHRLQIRAELLDALEERLESGLSLENEKLVRSFAQIGSIIEGGESVWLFRTVELLDLNPRAQSESTHFARIAAIFDVSSAHDEFFLLDKSGHVRQRLPESETPNAEIVGVVKELAAACGARQALSVTLSRGCGLIYFEPLVTGGEKLRDVDALYYIAKRMREELR